MKNWSSPSHKKWLLGLLGVLTVSAMVLGTSTNFFGALRTTTPLPDLIVNNPNTGSTPGTTETIFAAPTTPTIAGTTASTTGDLYVKGVMLGDNAQHQTIVNVEVCKSDTLSLDSVGVDAKSVDTKAETTLLEKSYTLTFNSHTTCATLKILATDLLQGAEFNVAYLIIIQVDPSNAVPESNEEENNTGGVLTMVKVISDATLAELCIERIQELETPVAGAAN